MVFAYAGVQRMIIKAVAACSLAANLTSCASARPEASDVETLARAESAFASASVATSMKASFLAAFADDAILFRPGPVNGKETIAARLDLPVVLTWRPQRVEVAASGELGYSTGPFRLTSKQDANAPASFGQFFSVWRKNGDGRWQVLIDHGVSHASPAGWNAPLELMPTTRGAVPEEVIDAAEARFARLSERDGVAAAYAALGGGQLRTLRDDAAPIAGAPTESGRWSWAVTDRGVARSRDFAWVIGTWRCDGSDAGHYVRVWHAESGVWKIAIDVLAPLPTSQ